MSSAPQLRKLINLTRNNGFVFKFGFLALFDESDQAELGPYYEKLREKFAGLMKEKVEVQAETDTLRRRYQVLKYFQFWKSHQSCLKFCLLYSLIKDPTA